MKRLLLVLAFLCFAAHAEAASRFWVGGDGTWDASDTTHWASSSGGAGGQSVPTSSDTCTFDGNSGAGTGLGGGPLVTPNANVTCSAFALGTTGGQFVGSLIFSTNNNSPTFTTFAFSGTGTRQLDMGNGTWTITHNGSSWDITTATGLTLNANSSTLSFTGSNAGTRKFFTGGKSYNIVSFGAQASGYTIFVGSNVTFATLQATAPIAFQLLNNGTMTLTNAPAFTGTSANPILFVPTSTDFTTTISIGSGNMTCSWCVFKNVVFSSAGNVTATNSLDAGGNSISGGGTLSITPPSSGGGKIIGG